jgi:predicted NBD/HSP70 family sugar kinase
LNSFLLDDMVRDVNDNLFHMKKNFLTTPSDGKRGAPNSAIVQALRERGALSQADLARLTGLGKATVSRAISELQGEGVVVDAGRALSPAGGASGRPAAALTLNPMSGTCVGLQLGPKSIRAVLADVSHRVLASRVVALDWDYSLDQGLDVTADLIDALQKEAKSDPASLIAVGIAMPSPVHPATSRVIRSSAIGTWAGLRVNEPFEERLRRPVFVENESMCAALAELTWGAAKGLSNFAYVKVESGIGGAVVANGALQRGISGGAGEFGHLTYDPNGPLCRCGNRGCFEVHLSDWALIKPMQEIHGEAFTIVDLIERAHAGDKACERILFDAAEMLARCLSVACNILNPDALMIAGSLLPAGDLLLQPLKQFLSRQVLIPLEESEMGPATRLLTASLGRDASALGAMGLALRQIGDSVAAT